MVQPPPPEDRLPAASEPEAEAPLPAETVQNKVVEPAQAVADADDLPSALLHLLVGGVLEGGEQISVRLRQWQAETALVPPASPAEANELPGSSILRALLVGAVFSASRTAHRSLLTARRLAQSASLAGFSLLHPLARLTPLQPWRRSFEFLAQRGQAEVNQWVRQGQLEELHSRRMVQSTIHGTLGDAIRLLSANGTVSDQLHLLIKEQVGALAAGLPQTPEVDALVQKLVNQVVTYLQANPQELEGLVRSQGDHYLDHLSENPGQVQDIVQGQSTSLADEMSDEVRERMVTADNVFELFVRSLLRRPLREELPPPKNEIRQRALRARLRDEAPGIEPPNHFSKSS